MKMQPISHFGNAEIASPYVTNHLFFADVYNLKKYYDIYVEKTLATVLTDLDGIILTANELLCTISKYELHELVGSKHSLLDFSTHGLEYYEALWKELSAGQVWREETCNRAKDGSPFWTDTTITPVHNSTGGIWGYLTIRLDISQRKEAEARADIENQRRRDAEALFNDIIETLPNGVVAYGPDARMIYGNKALKTLNDALIPGLPLAQNHSAILQHPAQRHTDQPAESPPAASHGHAAALGDHIAEIAGDRWIQVQNRMSPRGTMVSVQTEVTELKRARRKIELLAYSDSVTGAGNRHALVERLTALCATPDTSHTAALVLIDLTGFKMINDGMGHSAGDAVLRHVAQSLQSCVRQRDCVARIGGDEFAVLLRDIRSPANIRHILGKLASAVKRPVQIERRTIMPSASMGVATFPANGKTPEELMRNADIALYDCRHKGSAYSNYNGKMQKQHQRRRHLAVLMQQALIADEFYVELQPQIDITSGRHTGFEALARWTVEGTAIPPGEFIPIAEECGMIVAISYRIIEKALAILARLKASGLQPGVLGINIASAQLYEPNFSNKFIKILDKFDIKPNEIEIEVTENIILNRNSRYFEKVLHALYKKGISIALDDFGTGYASLAHLRSFPISRLKIDRSFVVQLNSKKDDYSIVSAIISLGHSLGLKVIAEGIETREQYQELCNLGCDAAQGYYCGRPRNEDGTVDYLKKAGQPQGCPP